ncbi:hypothetical protein C0J52_25671 [Blattella germanica]|nr:hypothetical protein C0J52_25671 [Blattella germanica]
MKDNVYVPANLQELRHRIRTAVAMVSLDMLKRVWGELEHRIPAVSPSVCGHIEQCNKTWEFLFIFVQKCSSFVG